MSAYIYILSSGRNGTLYVGVSSDLVQRVFQHKQHLADGFTKKYHVDQLVWYEQTDSIESAIRREKQIKAWNREWKIKLIEATNPYWNDLYSGIL
ncbi:GIY-YIG nuclease family protein [Undibacterium curvum]|uniref:GIY-YIG nuclease family protein n=1 Tax=Undibacterium curvum TaxID=2762294 RepID=A0ABR7A293_9BURK|nr:GIY-YIG nuclease family protein [Undibacterium curvum]MBC3930954.1 GIY-YIG nuclease family protein [Undibacterium curvum]